MLKPKKSDSQTLLNQSFIRRLILIFLIFGLLTSCVTTRTKKINNKISTTLQNDFYNNQFTGIFVVDFQKKDTLIALNSDKYFTPASNVKIFTLYSGLQLLPDQIPTLKYRVKNDTLFFKGVADPSWLHPYFNDDTGIKFLNQYKNLALFLDNFKEDKFGPGWAWEDYEYYFSPERSILPLYGNVVTAYPDDTITISPNYLSSFNQNKKGKSLRSIDENVFFIPNTLKDTVEIPFKTSDQLTSILLQERLTGHLTIADSFPEGEESTLYSIETDSIYKRMLYESDNFLAEQLMLNASSVLSDTIRFGTTRDYILKKHLSGLKNHPRWVDGSGLSRYNLFTPESFVHVLTLLKEEIDEERLYHLFPNWNASGTITRTFESEEPLFIYAKSGGMGNVYNLSGYLKTKSGKLLVFSFMNNHFRKPSSQVRQNMYSILKSIYEDY